MSYIWLVGVAIYVVGAVGQSLGANLQRLSFKKEEQKPVEDRLETHQQGMWRVGFVVLVLAGVFMSIALFFTAQTTLAPLCLFLFAGNYVFAYWLNDEPFSIWTDGIACVLVTAGVAMCLVVAPKDSDNYTAVELWDLIVSAPWITFAVLTSSFIILVAFIKSYLLNDREPDSLSTWEQTVLNMSWGTLPGTMGGINITICKMFFSLIVGESKANGVGGLFSTPLFYVIGFSLLGTFVLQMLLTIEGLEACTAIIVMSIFAVTEMIVAVSGGLLCFHDYNHFDTKQAVIFCIGASIAVLGVVLMARFRVELMREQADLSNSEPLLSSSLSKAEPVEDSAVVIAHPERPLVPEPVVRQKDD